MERLSLPQKGSGATVRAGIWETTTVCPIFSFTHSFSRARPCVGACTSACFATSQRIPYTYCMFWSSFCNSLCCRGSRPCFSPVRLAAVSLRRPDVSLASKIPSGEILKLPTRNAAAAFVWNAENSSASRKTGI